MSKNEANAKFIEVAKLLGMEASYFSGLYTVRLNGQYIGQMSAEAWLDHLRNCMAVAKRA